jgi:hypothetical protein
MTRTHKEQQAISMLKSRKFQPSEIARRTGLSKMWIEMKAKDLGMRPLTVAGVKNGK